MLFSTVTFLYRPEDFAAKSSMRLDKKVSRLKYQHFKCFTFAIIRVGQIDSISILWRLSSSYLLKEFILLGANTVRLKIIAFPSWIENGRWNGPEWLIWRMIKGDLLKSCKCNESSLVKMFHFVCKDFAVIFAVIL